MNESELWHVDNTTVYESSVRVYGQVQLQLG